MPYSNGVSHEELEEMFKKELPAIIKFMSDIFDSITKR